MDKLSAHALAFDPAEAHKALAFTEEIEDEMIFFVPDDGAWYFKDETANMQLEAGDIIVKATNGERFYIWLIPDVGKMLQGSY